MPGDNDPQVLLFLLSSVILFMIVIDDAGDLGKGSKYFVLAGVTVYSDCRKYLEEALKAARVKKFHFIDDSQEVRRTFISYISKMELKATIYVLEKAGIKTDEGILLFNLLRNVFPDDEKVLEIIIDDFLNNERKRRELENKLKYEASKYFNKPCRVKIMSEACLQVADYFASIYWRYIEKSDDSLFLLIKNKIKRIIYDIQ